MAWYDDLIVAQAARPATITSGEQHRQDALAFRRVKSGQHVRAIAARGEPHDHITLPPQRLHAPREDMLIAVVIANAGDGGRIGVQAQSGESPAFFAVSPDQFFRQMYGIGRAAAIAACENPAALLQTADHRSAE